MSYNYPFLQGSPCGAVILYCQDGTDVQVLTTQRAASVGEGRSLSAGGFSEVKDMFKDSTAFDDQSLEDIKSGLGEVEAQIGNIMLGLNGGTLDEARAQELMDALHHTFGKVSELKAMKHDPGEENQNKYLIMRDWKHDIYREVYEELGEDVKTIIPYAEFRDNAEPLWEGLVRSPGNRPVVHAVVQKALKITPEQMDQIMALPITSPEVAGREIITFALNDDPAVPVDTYGFMEQVADMRNGDELSGLQDFLARKEVAAKEERAIMQDFGLEAAPRPMG